MGHRIEMKVCLVRRKIATVVRTIERVVRKIEWEVWTKVRRKTAKV